MMNRLCELEGHQQSLKPSDYFDVIAGTGTGGISACMLGRLGMSMNEAIKAYVKLAKDAFSKKIIGMSGPTAYKGTKLREALKSMIRDAAGDENEPMRDEKLIKNGCKTMVFAMSKDNMTGGLPVLFRSYETVAYKSLDCSIWEALYASMAHPDLFKAIEIEDGSIPLSFVGGELGCSNPTAHVLAEVRNLYPDRHVSCIMSVGVGHARTVHIPDLSLSQRILRTPTQAVKDMAIDSERVAQDMAKRFRDTAQAYYRLSVDQGMQLIEDDWEQRGKVKAHTTTYMGKVETRQILSQATHAIRERKSMLPVRCIDGSVQPPPMEQATTTKDCPNPTSEFTGRDDQIQQVGTCIAGNANERRVCVAHGLGGAGKTQLALKTIERNRESWTHILYVDASSKDVIEGALRDFAKSKGIGETYKDVLSWLGSCREPWLVVFDNADHPSLNVHRYFPGGNRGSILLTTRLHGLVGHARGPGSVCHVSSMSGEDGLALLLKVAQLHDQNVAKCEMDAAYVLLKEFGCLALAIVHAGRYIAHSHLSISEYRELFLVRRQEMLEQYSLLEAKLDDYGKSVYTTWKMCYDLLKANGNARPMLWLIAYMHYDGIRQAIFQQATLNIRSYAPQLQQTHAEKAALHYMRDYLGRFLDSDSNWDPLKFSNAISELTSYSLIDFDRVNQTYRIHVLVQDWARTVIPQAPEFAVECTTILLSQSVNFDNTIESISFKIKLGAHVDKILLERGSVIGANHLPSFTEVYQKNARWDHQQVLEIQLREAREKELGSNHPDTLKSTRGIASTYWLQGQYDKAERLYVQVLDAHKQTLGENNTDTLGSMGLLASMYRQRGHYEKAEALQQQVVNGFRQLLGERNANSLTSMRELASMYRAQAKWGEAELLDEHVLIARKELLGEEHPDTLSSMLDLSDTYVGQKRWDEAQLLQEHVLAAYKELLGGAHPTTLVTMSKLAHVYEGQERWGEAQTLHERTLNTRKLRLGDEHPDTFVSMGYLASAYFRQGEWDKAGAMQERVVKGHQKMLGGGHPDTLVSFCRLSHTYQKQGRLAEAETLLTKVVDASEQTIGGQHPTVVWARKQLEDIQSGNLAV